MVVQDTVQELPRVGVSRGAENVGRWPDLLDSTVVQEGRSVAHVPGKAHLVRDHDHRHATLREFAHDVEDLTDQFRIKRRSDLVEKHEFRFHGQGTGDGNPLLLATRQLARI